MYYLKEKIKYLRKTIFERIDPDTFFKRMKEDHTGNGQLSTENRVIINYTLHPEPEDTKTLLPHIENFKHLYNKCPKKIVTGEGHGSEEKN